MPPITLLIATSNAGKASEMAAALDGFSIKVKSLCDMQAVECPLEAADTFIGNARLKALHYARHSGDWTLADDSGLSVDALDGEPGVYSARYAGSGASDADNNAKLLHKLADTPKESRTAHFICALVLAYKNRILAEAEGRVDGVILTAGKGENGFGYDPLFYVPVLGMTTAEMTGARKNEISHRGQAVSAMKAKMKTLLQDACG